MRIGWSLRLSLFALVLAVGGCGAGKLGDVEASDSAGSKLAKLLGLSKRQNDPAGDAQGQRITCPDTTILEGTEAARFYAGSPPSNANLRVQYAIEDTARECSHRDDKLVLKVGVAGKVLLGPAGNPGSFSVPVRVAVVRTSDRATVASKLYHAPATITAKRTEESFTVVSEPISVPFVHEHSEDDYSIDVGIDSAGGSERPEGERRKR